MKSEPKPSVLKRVLDSLKKVGKRFVAGAVSLAMLMVGIVVLPQTAIAVEAQSELQGCGYGQGGPKADALCWIDMSTFGTVTADELLAGPVSKDMNLNVGRYTISFIATASAGADGAQGVKASSLPTWGGAALGGEGRGYQNVAGKPAFYQVTPNTTGVNLIHDTINLSNIVVTDSQTNQKVTSGFSVVMADAESTGTGEGFSWQSDKALNEYARYVPDGWEQPCNGVLSGIGSTNVDCISAKNTTSGGRGILMVNADSPTWISSSFRNDYAQSLEGIAFAVVFSTTEGVVDVKQAANSDAEFGITSKISSDAMGTATSNGGSSSTGKDQFLSGADASTAAYTVKKTGGNTPEEAYDLTWFCDVNGTTTTPALSADGKNASISIPANGSGKCTATYVANPPTADPAKKTINPNTTATLIPTTTKGNGYIASVAFDNGETTKVVQGEGAWTIRLDDSGNVVATFTPDKDYTGTVTQQTYTITDEYGLTASSTLDIDINEPPAANPESVTVDQGATATLAPAATAGTGKLTGVAFDNGQTTKKVDGEGTWSISIDDSGVVSATFAPEDGFTGPVTQQKYTVTDENGLTASSTLDVVIRPVTGDDSKAIKPNQTATLKPETNLGSSKVIDAVVFDNGKDTKVVEGEGTWKISVEDGKVVATFTPETNYHGSVTDQQYTITDKNGEKASGNLSVTIEVAPPAASPAKTTADQGETATLKPETTLGTGDLASVVFDNGKDTKVVEGEGMWKISLEDGVVVSTFTPEDGFTGPVTQQLYTVTDVYGLSASSTLDVVIRPETGDAETTINPNTTATLNPATTPGSGAITDVKFDNGQSEKTVSGEGKWTIGLDDSGKVVASFVPEEDYDGSVTSQTYKVTDQNGESAEGKLYVNINVPPQAKDSSKVIKPNETATVKPVTTPGNSDIETVTFDNGETSKTVPGEGTWTIELKNGEVVATFTPEQDYDGSVTSQKYTITDKNGLSADANLGITIIHTGLNLKKGYEIVSDANGNGINDKGDVIRWTFDVTNTGNTALNDVSIDDPMLEKLGIDVSCNPTTLAARGSGTCVSDKYTITDADVEAGSIKNVATATGKVPADTPGNPADPTSPESKVEIPTSPTPAPSLSMVKKASLEDKNGNGKADKGEKINYSFDVTNTGNVALNDVRINDPKLTKLGIGTTCSPSNLAPAGKATCTADKPYTVTEQDVKNGKVLNVATATGAVPSDTPGHPGNPTSEESKAEVPTAPAPAKPFLASTGTRVAMVGIVALLLFAMGGVLIFVRRKQAI